MFVLYAGTQDRGIILPQIDSAFKATHYHVCLKWARLILHCGPNPSLSICLIMILVRNPLWWWFPAGETTHYYLIKHSFFYIPTAFSLRAHFLKICMSSEDWGSFVGFMFCFWFFWRKSRCHTACWLSQLSLNQRRVNDQHFCSLSPLRVDDEIAQGHLVPTLSLFFPPGGTILEAKNALTFPPH